MTIEKRAVASPAPLRRLRTPIDRLRVVVLVVALATTAFKLVIADNSYGTNDVHYWTSFAQGVRDYGAIEIYGKALAAPYNHPPLSGLMLVVVNQLLDWGIGDLPFLIRVPASVADVVSAVLVYELVRLRRPAGEAAVAGILLALSPALMVISGFHGNTDPLFVMFTLLSVYLVAVRKDGFDAGLAFAAAVSIKLVPIVLAPMLLVVLFRMGRRPFLAFLGGGVTLFLPLWGPVLVLAWPEFSADVLGYAGIGLREWGIPQFIVWAQGPPEWIEWLVGPGRFVVLLISGALPAVLVWRRPDAIGPAAGLGLALFLLQAPAFGMQYLVWPLAAAYLVNVWLATAYNVAISALIISVYNNWNGVAWPWEWSEAVAVGFRPHEFPMAVAAWACLAAVAVGAAVIGVRGRRTRAVH